MDKETIITVFLVLGNIISSRCHNVVSEFIFIQVFVVCFTVFGGLMTFNYHHDLHVWVVPLLLVTFFAYLVAHGFLSVFETIVDVLFLCFAIDIETNDGSPEKPYFMDEELMVSSQKWSSFVFKNGNKKTEKGGGYSTFLPCQ